MKILLIEDDQNKIKRISDYIREICSDYTINVVRSRGSALKRILAEPWDLLLLDMSLPIFEITKTEDGYNFDGFAGRYIMQEMYRKHIKTKTIIITQYETFDEGNECMTLDELKIQLASEYKESYIGTVYYNSAQTDWKFTLKEFISKV